MNTDFVLVSKNELTVLNKLNLFRWSLSSIETLNLFASSSELESAVRTQSVRVPTQMIASYF